MKRNEENSLDGYCACPAGLGRDLSLTSRQLQMLHFDLAVAASPGIAKGSQWPRLGESRELECGLGWTSECLSTCRYFGKCVVFRGISQVASQSLGFLTALDSSVLSAVHRFPVYLWGGVEKKTLSRGKTFRCHLGKRDPST